jgi:hypothetical protein
MLPTPSLRSPPLWRVQTEETGRALYWSGGKETGYVVSLSDRATMHCVQGLNPHRTLRSVAEAG